MKRKKLLSERLAWFFAAMAGIGIGILLAAYAAAWGTVWFWVLLCFTVLASLVLYEGYLFILKPYQDTTKKLGLFAVRPNEAASYQILYPYNKQMEWVIERLREYRTASTTLEMSKRQAQYQALQNQINPHFLYNTLESIRSEALIAGLDSVADMCEALASFFRYTISNMENLVTVEQEIENIQTYFYIQRYRFGERLHLEIQCADEDREIAMKCLVPKLTLQPIVENAIIHGIEQKIGEGTVTIQMMLTEKRLLIHVSDDGIGMDQETLNRINKQMTERSVKGKSRGGIAVGNVSNRIKLLFGDAYGVTVFSTQDVGTDVEITLPRTSEQDRKSIQGKAEEMK